MSNNDCMTVYMVAIGEKCEGVGKTQLHYSLEGAIATAREWMERSYFEWKEVVAHCPALREWEGGCDYIEITEKKILK